MPDLQALLDQIDRLDQQATQGPWDATTSEATMNDRSLWRIGQTSKPQVSKSVMRTADAEFIALARTALPALSRAVRAVMEDCQSIENLVHKDHTYRTEFDYGMRSQARAVMEAITDTLGDDDGNEHHMP